MADFPLSPFHFQVEWEGAQVVFLKVLGLNIYVESEKESYEDITLSRPVFSGKNEFYNWIKSRKNGKLERKDIVISLLNERHEPTVIWKVKNAYPIRYLGPTLDAEKGGFAVETLVLKHEGWEMEHLSEKKKVEKSGKVKVKPVLEDILKKIK